MGKKDKGMDKKKRRIEKRKDLVLSYFTSRHLLPRLVSFIIFIVFLAVAAILYFLTELEMIAIIFAVIAFLAFVVWLLFVLRVFDHFIKDSEFDEMVQQDYHEAYLKAFDYLGITKDDATELQPIVAVSPERFPGTTQLFYKYAKTGQIRYSQARYLIIFFGEKQLYVFKALVNHVTGVCSYETTLEFDYFDVSTIKTAFTLDESSRYKREILTLKLGLINGDSVDIILRDAVIDNTEYGVHDLKPNEKEVIHAVKTLIREKRYL